VPKSIAITPSWYWPAGIARGIGIPPFSLYELCVARAGRRRPGDLAVVAGDVRLTAADFLRAVDRAAGALQAEGPPGRRAVLGGESTLENLVLLFAALAAGVRVRITPPGADLAAAAAEFGAEVVLAPGAAHASGSAPSLPALGSAVLRQPAVTIDGTHGPISHSHRSLLASALAFATFFDVNPRRPWLASLPLSRWEGLASVLTPLFLGAPLVLSPVAPGSCDPEALVAAIGRERAGYALFDMAEAASLTREAKKSIKAARRVLDVVLLSTPGVVDPDARRRVFRGFECPALTIFGMPETGPIFASHQSWYIDESVGIPITNAHVVPADPETGARIQAHWELVHSAEVTVRTPALMADETEETHADSFIDSRFRTGVMAASDENGMVYLV
jgi:acyl-CoA synthetase (AMP-forming)/AMP-acid ligase II